jgi:hypothetical protein
MSCTIGFMGENGLKKPATVYMAAFCLGVMTLRGSAGALEFWRANDQEMAGVLVGISVVTLAVVLQILFRPTPWGRRCCGLLLGLGGVVGAGVSVISLKSGADDPTVEVGRLVLSLVLIALYLAFARGKRTKAYFDRARG